MPSGVGTLLRGDQAAAAGQPVWLCPRSQRRAADCAPEAGGLSAWRRAGLRWGRSVLPLGSGYSPREGSSGPGSRPGTPPAEGRQQGPAPPGPPAHMSCAGREDCHRAAGGVQTCVSGTKRLGAKSIPDNRGSEAGQGEGVLEKGGGRTVGEEVAAGRAR